MQNEKNGNKLTTAVIAFGIADTIPIINTEPGKIILSDGSKHEVPLNIVLASRESCIEFINKFFDQLEAPEKPQLMLAE